MANNIVVRDAGGANVVFSTLYDAGANVHRTQVLHTMANSSGGADLQFNNLNPSANLITWTAAGTTTANSANQTNFNHRGLILYYVATANSAAAANTVAQITVNNIDPVSGRYFPVLVTANITSIAVSNSTNNPVQSFQIYPGIGATANVNVSAVLSRTFAVNVTFTAQGTNTSTGQITYALIV